MSRSLRIAFSVASLAVGSALAAPPASVSGCGDCHGYNGVSTRGDVPTIAGVSAFYTEGQMQVYQKGQRPCLRGPKDKTDMCEVAKKMNAAQVKEAAAYYAGLKFVAAKQPTDAGLAAKGKAVHAAGCEKCHTDGGSEAADDAGILAGQWKPYLQATFKDYHDGKRPQTEKMKPVMDKLSDADTAALVEYYASGAAK